MSNDNEIFLPINGFNENYEVSNYGNIRSVDRLVKSRWGNYRRILGKYIKYSLDEGGYCCLTLYKNQVSKPVRIHRLVALHFVPNPLNKPQVNHIDGNKENNHFENLEWNTCSENIKHAYRSGLMKPNTPVFYGSKHWNARKVIQFTKSGEIIREWNSIKEAEDLLCHGKRSNITEACKGSIKSSRGFKWAYKD